MDESQVPIGDGRPEAEGVPQVVDPAALPELTGDGFVQDAGPRQLPKPLGPRRWTHTFVALLAASLAGSLALIPFTWTLLKSANAALIPESLFPLIMVFTVILELLISAASIGIGLALGPSAKLGQMVVSLDGGIEPSARRRLRMWIVEPLAMGMVLGGLTAAFAMALHPGGSAVAMPSAWEGLLASIGAGIREEVWLRFGLMTFLAGLGCAITRRLFGIKSEHFTALIITIANIAAALMFAAIHIPQAHMLLGLSTKLLVFIVIGNGGPGLVFGWLYWRRGLLPAMLAHFGLDIVLKVVLPLALG